MVNSNPPPGTPPVIGMIGGSGLYDIPGLENLTQLGKLPARGATLIALPMKIENGTGGPCRVVALLPSE